MIQAAILKIIRFYQNTLSPDHSLLGRFRHPYGFCRFYPSCSEYAYRAIKRQGITRGLLLTVWRLLRCNPLSKGGIDTVK